jgi:hypothetical protein
MTSDTVNGTENDRLAQRQNNETGAWGRDSNEDIFSVAFEHRPRWSLAVSSVSMQQIRRAFSASLFSTVGAWRRNADGPSRQVEESQPQPSESEIRNNENLILKKHGTHRLKLWVALLISSCVCLAALYPTIPPKENRPTSETFAMVTPSVSIALSTAGYIALLLPQDTMKYVDLVTAALCFLMWSAGMKYIFQTDELMIGEGSVSKEDLYKGRAEEYSNILFSTWCSFVASLLLLTTWFKWSVTTTDWVVLTVLSFALFFSSTFSYRKMVSIDSEDGTSASYVQACSILDDHDCPRMVFGQYLGLVCGTISLLMILLATRLSAVFNIIVGTLMFLSYCFGVSYISSAGGHGISASGSLYLEIWACVFISLDVATTNIAIFVRRKRDDAKDDDDDNAPNQSPGPGGDRAPVEEESSADNLSQMSDYGGDSLAMTNNFFSNLSITNR